MTNRAKRLFVTGCLSMAKLASRTGRTGPSPSSGKPTGSSAPIRNSPSGTCGNEPLSVFGLRHTALPSPSATVATQIENAEESHLANVRVGPVQ